MDPKQCLETVCVDPRRIYLRLLHVHRLAKPSSGEAFLKPVLSYNSLGAHFSMHFFLEMLLARVEYGRQILRHRLGARIAHNRFVCQSAKHEIHISSLLFFVAIILLLLLCVR